MNATRVRVRIAVAVAAVIGLLSILMASAAPAQAAITGQSASNDETNVQYGYQYTGSPSFLRVYIDTDRNPGTGFATGGIGADYLLENASLYQHLGGGWNWGFIKTVQHSGGSGNAAWTLARSDIGETASPNEADLVFQTEAPLDTSPVHTHVYSGGGGGGDTIVDYSASGADIANPERGFYHHTGDCDKAAFSQATLEGYRANQQITLVMCVFYLEQFKNAPISQAALNFFQQQADTVREAGLKMILRFAYTQSTTGDDAPLSRVQQHLDQLAPYLSANSDVIHIMQSGFIGAWGEWWYTQHFGDQGNVSQADWVNRKAVVDKILDVLPADRMVQLRTPAFKRTMYSTSALDPSQAHNGTDLARIGHHNDCFLASPDDFGTYQNPAVEYPYLADETRYLGMGGETCNPNPPRSQCPTALDEMSLFHYNYLNTDYRPEVLSSWVAGGCMDQVRRSLGHRFELDQGEYPDSASGSLAVRITLENQGWAAPFNPRPVQLVLRETSTGQVHKRTLNADPRFWLPGGAVVIEQSVSLGGIPSGDYELLLHLPDPESTLAARPEYAMRFASNGVWEPSTGFNDLLHTVTIG